MQGEFLFILEREFSSHCVPAAGRSEVIALYSPRSRLLDYFMFGLMTLAQNITLFGALKYVQAYIQSNKLQCSVLYSIFSLVPAQTPTTNKNPQLFLCCCFFYTQFLFFKSSSLSFCLTATPPHTPLELSWSFSRRHFPPLMWYLYSVVNSIACNEWCAAASQIAHQGAVCCL